MNKFSFRIWQKVLLVLRFIMVSLKGGEECLVCGNVSWIMPLCSHCVSTVFNVHEALSKKRCTICGKPLVSEQGLCMECRKGTVYKHTDEVLPLFGYRLWNKELLFQWKIMGIRSLSPFFASCFNLASREKEIKVLVPVPPRKGKIQKKGWDQIDEISRFLENTYGFIVLRILQRNSSPGKETVEQKKLNRIQRIETIGKNYSLLSGAKLEKELKKTGGKMPEDCCLIDDILTTGSTVESCAEVLKEGGVKTVRVLALFTAG